MIRESEVKQQCLAGYSWRCSRGLGRLAAVLFFTALLGLSAVATASEERHEVSDAEQRHEVSDAEQRHEVPDADQRHEVSDADQRHEVLDAEQRNSR